MISVMPAEQLDQRVDELPLLAGVGIAKMTLDFFEQFGRASVRRASFLYHGASRLLKNPGFYWVFVDGFKSPILHFYSCCFIADRVRGKAGASVPAASIVRQKIASQGLMEFAVGPIVSRSRLASWLALAALRLPGLTRLIIARLFRLQRHSDGVRFLSGLLLAGSAMRSQRTGFPSRFRCSLPSF
jgi:hypothetical protein